MQNRRSEALLMRNEGVVPGGVHSNFRSPVYFARARGSHLWDVDNNEYVDCVVNNGACILGHADPDVFAAVIEAAKSGLTVSLESELSLGVARQLHEMIPCAEQVRFANSGTEAVMKAIMIARAATGRRLVVKTEGAYHGWFDEAQVSVHPPLQQAGPPESPVPVLETLGIRDNTAESVVVVCFNDLPGLQRTLEVHRGQVAAVLVEPVVFNSGCILPDPGYLEGVRQLTKEQGIILIFDEVITGFRLAPGGAQERFGILPDLSTFAKAIANGYPLSAVAGRADLMRLTRPGGEVLYGGTYNGQHVALAAASVCLAKLRSGDIQRYLDTFTERLRQAFANLALAKGVKASLVHCGGEFQIYFSAEPIRDYRAAARADAGSYAVFAKSVLEEGVWMKASPLFHHGVAWSHDEHDFERIVAGFGRGLDAVVERRQQRSSVA